jgi:hypothetical protein
MSAMTWEERLARQRVVWDALFVSSERYFASRRGSPERLEWAWIRQACMRESNRLARIAARQRREQAA